MHCLAISLDSDSNKILFEVGQKLSQRLHTSFIIENFHLTLLCANGGMECKNFIDEFKKEKFTFRHIYPLRWVVLEGKTTDFDYLVLEVYLPKKILNTINELRLKLCGQTTYEYKPHVSVIKAPKGALTPEIIQYLNTEYPNIKTLVSKNLIEFNHEYQIIKCSLIQQELK